MHGEIPSVEGNPVVPDPYDLGSSSWFNENASQIYEVRLEINRSDTIDGGGNYTTHVWFDCQDCSDLSDTAIKNDVDPEDLFNATAYLTDSMELNATWHSAFDQIMFGWTEGTGSLRQNVTITSATFYFPGEE